MNRRLVMASAVVVLLAAAGLGLVLSSRGGAPAIAQDNPCDVFPSLDGALSSWMRTWRQAEPALTCEHFEQADTVRLRVEPNRTVEAGELSNAPGRWRSPAGQSVLRPTATGELELHEPWTSTARILLPASGGVKWTDAAWMDERSFVAAGRGPGDVPGTLRPVLTVVRLDANESSTFRGPAVPESEAPPIR